MDKLLANGKCKLASQTFATYYENVYGVRCTENNNDWLHLFLWAYESGCIPKDTDCKHCNCVDCNECAHCNIQNNIGKITKYCKDCKPKKYMEPIVIPNSDYTDWYNSEEYIDCLNIQLEENGWIEPMIDLCRNLNINISQAEFCKLLVSSISARELDCFMITDIQVADVCSTIISSLDVEAACKSVDISLIADDFCKMVINNINN